MVVNYNIVNKCIYHSKYNERITKCINGIEYELSSSSSCIINHPRYDDKYILIIRYINYYLDKFGNIVINKNKIITFNKILFLDYQLNVEQEYFLDTFYEQ